MTDTNSKAQVTDAAELMQWLEYQAKCCDQEATEEHIAHLKAIKIKNAKRFRAVCTALAAQEKPEPGVAVAGYRRRLPQYAFEHYEFEQPDYANPNIADWEPLYLHPAPSPDLPEGEVEPLDRQALTDKLNEKLVDVNTKAYGPSRGDWRFLRTNEIVDVVEAFLATSPSPIDKGEVKTIRQRTIEECAKVIEENVLTNTSDGEELRPRQNGNIAGIGYAAAIRSLGKEGSGE